MNKMAFGFFLALFAVVLMAGATNFDRIVLGSGNYNTDPNTSADIVFQNDEYVSNSVDGTLNFGAANITTTGQVSTGNLTSNQVFADSTVGPVLVASDGTLWRLKVQTNGTVESDSTGLN